MTSRNPNPENCGSLRLLGAGNEDVYSSSIVLGTTSEKRNTTFQKLSTSEYIHNVLQPDSGNSVAKSQCGNYGNYLSHVSRKICSASVKGRLVENSQIQRDWIDFT